MNRAIALVAAAGLAGCASTSPNQSYSDVAKLVEDRGGSAPHWDQHAPEDQEVEKRVNELLTGELGADGAVEVALLRNPVLLATYESVGVAQADLVQAGLLANPTLGLGIGFPIGGQNAATELRGSLTEDFLTLFTLPLRKRFAEYGLARAKLRVGAAVLELATEVRDAYYKVQASQQTAVLWQTIVDAESSSSELSQRQFRAGNIAALEAVNRRAAFEQARLDLARAENEVLDAREVLNRKMGVWGGQTDWKVKTNLPEVPRAEVSLEHLEKRAIAQRLDLAASGAESDSLGAALSLAGGTRYFANLNLGVDASRDPEGSKVLGPTLSLELPIFDQHQAQLAKLAAQYREARARRSQLAIEIRSEVRSARNHVLATRSVVEHYRSVLLPLRERIVQLSQQSYDGMFLGVYGLLQARQNEVAAYRDYIDAVRAYWSARAELERAVGGKLPAAEASPPAAAPTTPATQTQPNSPSATRTP
jgi:cobalt-zinc-cadmium efflux system outer membrane protein